MFCCFFADYIVNILLLLGMQRLVLVFFTALYPLTKLILKNQ